MGRVVSAELTQDMTKLRGIYVDCALRAGRFIPEQQIALLGDVAVFVRQRGRRAKLKKDMPPRRALSTDGQRLGAISGAVIDENTRDVAALVFSRGYIDDLLTGRQLIRQFMVNRESGDVVLTGMDAQYRTHPKGGEIL